MRTQFSFIWPNDRTLSDVNITNLSGPESDANEGVLRIPQSSSITGASPSDCLMTYAGYVEIQLVYSTGSADWATRHSLGELHPSVKIQSVYSTGSADWATSVGEGKTLNLKPFVRKNL